MHTDPIADLINRIKNSAHAEHDMLNVKFSKIKYQICEILKKHHYINDFQEITSKEGHRQINIVLNPIHKSLEVHRVSKPGQRIYRKITQVRRVKNGYGIGIYSTSQGLMTDREVQKKHLGGELLCTIF